MREELPRLFIKGRVGLYRGPPQDSKGLVGAGAVGKRVGEAVRGERVQVAEVQLALEGAGVGQLAERVVDGEGVVPDEVAFV